MAESARARPSLSFPLRMQYYIAKEYFLSLAVSFSFFFIVFFINQILLLAEDILSRSAPFDQVMLLLLYSLPSVIAISFPFASLAGALMTVAKLNADNEILAAAASGISTRSLYVPFAILGIMASLASFVSNDYFLPRGTRAFSRLYSELIAKSASIELTPWSVRQYSQAVIVTGPKDKESIRNILLFDNGSAGAESVISAREATIEIAPGASDVLLRMTGVTQHQLDRNDPDKFSVSRADEVDYKFSLRQPDVGFATGGPSEMSSMELLSKIGQKEQALLERIGDAERQESGARDNLISAYLAALQENAGSQAPPQPAAPRSAKPAPPARALSPSKSLAPSAQENVSTKLANAFSSFQGIPEAKPADRSLQLYKLEYSKKFAIPAAGFFFALLAFPLGLGSRKAGRTAGFGIALLLSVLYWGLLFAGQTFGLRSQVDPILAMWMPNALIFLATVVLWIIRKTSGRRAV